MVPRPLTDYKCPYSMLGHEIGFEGTRPRGRNRSEIELFQCYDPSMMSSPIVGHVNGESAMHIRSINHHFDVINSREQ